MIQLSSIKKDQKEEKKIYKDINCDIAQSFGVYRNDSENELLPYVTSVNISCGSHAGDPLTIANSLKLAKEKGLAVGAHIGFPDIQGFGYRAMQLDEEEIRSVVLYQIGAISALAKAFGVEIEHVRPHGALYKQAACDFNTSLAIAKAIASYNPWLMYVGAAGEALSRVAEESKIKVAHEVFLDKVYKHDATIDFDANDVVDLEYSTMQINSLMKFSTVKNNQGGFSKLTFDTIHLSMKSQFSLDVAKQTSAVVKNPAPLAVSIVKDTSWI